jgi:hypothetical protein
MDAIIYQSLVKIDVTYRNSNESFSYIPVIHTQHK